MKGLSKDRLWSIAVLTPSIILIAVFVYGFIARSVYVSMTDWGNDPAQALAMNPIIRFTGLTNYQDLFTGFLQGRFRQELVSTIFFTLFFILGCLGLGLGLALILDRNPRGEGLWRTIFLFPMSLSFIVTGTIWRWMLQPGGGVNQADVSFLQRECVVRQIVRGHPLNAEGHRRRQVDAFGNRCDFVGSCDAVFSVRALRGDGEHAVADGDAGDAGADRVDDAGCFCAEGEWWHTLVLAAALINFNEIQTGRGDLDANFALLRLGHGNVFEGEGFGAAVLIHA